ncbi:hypothetical protein SAMN06265371_101225 [Lutibacter agarilyticus]|uniref:Uncharacterized protein n=1 Tax=Lutibacter agarilyticus TaxID=1109740 RepID=A0A238VCZ6_9FLAO|nr:hypothetical protein [Lutibacter agarilyticus]SNR32091.1 hypothetical protein SAMN06265371_101225 [Lutibacter agarilyticus]
MKKQKLHKVAPILNSISKKSGFNTPNEYFETLEIDILSKIKTEELNSEIDKNSFRTPDAYFDTIEDIVIAKLKAKSFHNKENTKVSDNYFDTLEDTVISKLKTPKRVISLKTVSKYLVPIAIAASLLLIFTLNTNKKTVTFESLATTDLELFIDYGMVDIDTQTLASTFSDIEIKTEEFDLFLTDSEVLNYLTDEDLETFIYTN